MFPFVQRCFVLSLSLTSESGPALGELMSPKHQVVFTPLFVSSVFLSLSRVFLKRESGVWPTGHDVAPQS